MATLDPSLSTEASPLAMVVLSDEQFWPSVEGLLHWQQGERKVQDLCVYYSNDRGPAARLQRLVEICFPGVNVVLHFAAQDTTAQAVRDTVRAWMSDFPGRHWVLNATGGSKLLTLGLAGFVGEAGVQVIVRHGCGDWVELVRSADGQTLESRKIDGVDPQGLDKLPITDLVRSQFNAAPEALEFAFQAAEPLPVKRLTSEGISNGWNWPAAFTTCGLKAEASPDVLFSDYVAAGLREMGVSNLAHTLRLASKRDRKERQEIDLIASHGGKVLVLDLKLGSQAEDQATQPSLIPQIRRAADNRQRLAGLSAQMVLVRPCRLFDENERDLAKAYGVDVIDQRDAPRLFSRLAGYLKLSPLPAEMEAVETLLVQQIAERGRLLVFGADYERLRQQAADSGGPEWVDLEGYLNRVRVERGQNWLLWANRTEIVLRLDRPANAPDELPSLIQSALSNFGRVRVESTANGYEAIFPREASRLTKLRQALAGFVNRRLETMVFVQVRPAGPVKAPERPVKSIISPSYHKGGTGSLEDLDAAFDQVLPPKSPSRKT